VHLRKLIIEFQQKLVEWDQLLFDHLRLQARVLGRDQASRWASCNGHPIPFRQILRNAEEISVHDAASGVYVAVAD
jgi:hypothetical protein